jgi:uncharacterized protein (UPF0332 family)
MAIINSLEKCLDSPYLRQDATAPEQVGGLIQFASERLELASALHRTPKSDPADTVMLAYEAMFACVRALVYREGYREASLRCLLIALDHFYVRTNRLDPSLIHEFHRAQSLELGPEQAIGACQRLLDRTRELTSHH